MCVYMRSQCISYYSYIHVCMHIYIYIYCMYAYIFKYLPRSASVRSSKRTTDLRFLPLPSSRLLSFVLSQHATVTSA